jgi:hypothetical protein
VNAKRHFYYLFLAACCAAFQLNSCSAPRTGPKMIEADGVRYIACGGALWMRSEGNSKDPATMTYEIVFKDALGSNHRLTMVHTLSMTDLPSDTPECANSSSPSGAGTH